MDTTAPDAGVVRIAVDLACRAPSVHNSQPWRWLYTDGRLDLHGDRTRLLASTDPSGRQLMISCGAALGHLRVALTSLRWRTSIELLPEAALPNLVAAIRFHRDAEPRSHDFDLVTAIKHRRTDRRPFAPPARAPGLFDALREAADRHGATLTVLPPDAEPELAAASNASAASRKYDSSYQAELHWWAGHSFPFEGIPANALATELDSSRVGVGREFPTPARNGPEPTLPLDAATVLVISTTTDLPTDWARCGEALSAVLLEATALGNATCPLTHLTEVERSREMIRELAPDAGYPQILVRVGTALDPVPLRATPRRPTTEVLRLG
ncbi:Acg family FMN-binding oxidoreductase [Rhodococcus sp. NPDC127528]|uniref:Acg family FMN-binding oxidoreductase n=1 Tax=unclassified Rhodococcus (in: high G+C Gram-positive bacteria) TaxID=192944 RepID=UPI00364162AA